MCAFHLWIAFKSEIPIPYHVSPRMVSLQKLFSTNLDQVRCLYAYSRDVTVLPWPVSMIRKWPPHLRSWSRSIIPNICKTLHFEMVMKTSDEDPKALTKKETKLKIIQSTICKRKQKNETTRFSFHPLKNNLQHLYLNWTHSLRQVTMNCFPLMFHQYFGRLSFHLSPWILLFPVIFQWRSWIADGLLNTWTKNVPSRPNCAVYLCFWEVKLASLMEMKKMTIKNTRTTTKITSF